MKFLAAHQVSPLSSVLLNMSSQSINQPSYTMEPQTFSTTKWSDENIIDLIRKLRNYLIKDFLDERFLKEYLHRQFAIREIPLVRIEFIKAALKELLIAPVDTRHYRLIIEEIRENDSASL